MIIVFTSDDFVGKKGFKAKISFFRSRNYHTDEIIYNEKILIVKYRNFKIRNDSISVSSSLGGNCKIDEFPCANGVCINTIQHSAVGLLCNGEDDCGDNSDETTVCSGITNHSQ